MCTCIVETTALCSGASLCDDSIVFWWPLPDTELPFTCSAFMRVGSFEPIPIVLGSTPTNLSCQAYGFTGNCTAMSFRASTLHIGSIIQLMTCTDSTGLTLTDQLPSLGKNLAMNDAPARNYLARECDTFRQSLPALFYHDTPELSRMCLRHGFWRRTGSDKCLAKHTWLSRPG